MNNEYSLNAKYPELLKEVAPAITQVAVLRDASQGSGIGHFAVIQAIAPLLRMQASAIDLLEAREIENALAAFARSATGGLIMPASAAGRRYHDLIIALAARHKLPAIYAERHFAAAGGLITYGASWIDQYRLAAGYVDRILKGENAADLPVQAPTKLELVINLKSAKALGLTVPPTLLARADEVIE
jgi:putative ABC transport system substrate-binding protein